MDITRGEMVEAELDAMIRRRDAERRKTEGERLKEALWAESERKYAARRREENRVGWFEYEMRLYRIHSGLAAEHLARAERLENGREKGAT